MGVEVCPVHRAEFKVCLAFSYVYLTTDKLLFTIDDSLLTFIYAFVFALDSFSNAFHVVYVCLEVS